MERKEQGSDFIQKCKDLENTFIKLNLMQDRGSSSYLQLIKNVANNSFETSFDEIKRSFKNYEKNNQIEVDAFYYHFLECMYYALIERETSLNSTNYVQYHTIKEMANTAFTYGNYKAMINHSIEMEDFENIENRIPLLLGVTYYLLYEQE